MVVGGKISKKVRQLHQSGMRYGPDYNKEIECCRKAIELAPKYATPWNNMGTAYYHLGNYQKPWNASGRL